MPRIRLERRLVRWGNGYGIRLTKAEAERLGATERTKVSVDIETDPEGFDPSRLRHVRLGREASTSHDDLLGEALDAEP